MAASGRFGTVTPRLKFNQKQTPSVSSSLNFYKSVVCRGERRVKAGAEGINRRQFFVPEGDLDVPSGFAKNGDAHGVGPNKCC